MVEDRKLAVLRAIVEDYVATEEPVGSKALVERHQLGVSPATVRNDMAALEEEGFITQPHTSAGRVPTDKGYRLFVDRLTTVKPMSTAERRAIATFLDGAVDLDDVVQRSRAAARPADPAGRGRAVPDALPLHRPPRRAGRADADPAAGRADPQHRPGRAARGRAPRRAVDDDALADLRDRGSTGRPSASASPTRPPRWPRCTDAGAATRTARRAGAVVAALVEAMSDHRSDERVAVGGTANLARFGDGFDTAVRPLLEALEEHVVLLKLLGEADHRRRR